MYLQCHWFQEMPSSHQDNSSHRCPWASRTYLACTWRGRWTQKRVVTPFKCQADATVIVLVMHHLTIRFEFWVCFQHVVSTPVSNIGKIFCTPCWRLPRFLKTTRTGVKMTCAARILCAQIWSEACIAGSFANLADSPHITFAKLVVAIRALLVSHQTHGSTKCSTKVLQLIERTGTQIIDCYKDTSKQKLKPLRSQC